MHIDILVIMNNKWYPIELKYKTKGCKKIIDNEIFNLKIIVRKMLIVIYI